MTHIVTADTSMAYIVMAYMAMADIVMAYIVMACIVIAGLKQRHVVVVRHVQFSGRGRGFYKQLHVFGDPLCTKLLLKYSITGASGHYELLHPRSPMRGRSRSPALSLSLGRSHRR